MQLRAHEPREQADDEAEAPVLRQQLLQHAVAGHRRDQDQEGGYSRGPPPARGLQRERAGRARAAHCDRDRHRHVDRDRRPAGHRSESRDADLRPRPKTAEVERLRRRRKVSSRCQGVEVDRCLEPVMQELGRSENVVPHVAVRIGDPVETEVEHGSPEQDEIEQAENEDRQSGERHARSAPGEHGERAGQEDDPHGNRTRLHRDAGVAQHEQRQDGQRTAEDRRREGDPRVSGVDAEGRQCGKAHDAPEEEQTESQENCEHRGGLG
jgi:hypothetical protein